MAGRGRRDAALALAAALCLALAVAATLRWRCETWFGGDWRAMLDAPLHPGWERVEGVGYVPTRPLSGYAPD